LSAVHPAAAVRHRGRSARMPAPRPRSTAGAQVHGQFASHGVVPLISRDPLPRFLNHTDDGLAAAMDVHMLNDDLLLSFPPMPVEGVQQRFSYCAMKSSAAPIADAAVMRPWPYGARLILWQTDRARPMCCRST